MTEPLLWPRQVYYLHHADAPLNIADGAVRSGKSVAQNYRWVKHLVEMPRKGLYLMTGVTQDTIVRNVLAPMAETFGEDQVRWSTGPDAHAVIFGRRCPIIGANNVRSEYTVRGMTLHGWYADEVTLYPEAVFDMALTRLSVPGAKAFVNCNPDSPYHWLMRNYMTPDKLASGMVKRFRFRLADNGSLDPEYLAMIRQSFSGLFQRRMIEGEWALGEGVIFDMFDAERHVLEVPGTFERYVVSVDYGTANPCVFGLWVPYAGGWHMLSEYVWDSRDAHKQKTDEEYCDAMAAWLSGVAKSRGIDEIVPAHMWVDPSATSFIAALRTHGYRVQTAVNSVLDGIRTMATALSERGMTFDPSCTWTTGEFASYIWDEAAAKRGEDKPLKQNDHGMDMARYLIASERKPSVWDYYSQDD